MKVETYHLIDWEESDAGLLLAENGEWILVKHIRSDYAIDGYRLYKKQFVKSRTRDDKEMLIEKVLQLKNVQTDIPEGFQFADTAGLLTWMESKYGLFEFQDEDESELFYGKINELNKDYLRIDMINIDGTVESNYDYEFSLNQIRLFTFESDYFQSIQLLWRDELS